MRSIGADTATRGRTRNGARLLAAATAFAALAVVAFSGMSTSSARIAASTDSNGLLSTATVAIDQASSSTGLFFDANNLYPGSTTTGCVTVEYSGSASAELRLAAEIDGGSGLDEFIDIRLTARPGGHLPDL